MAPMTATPWAPVAITDSTVATVMPAMAMTGTSTASTAARTPSHADGVGQPHPLEAVANVGPTPR